MWARLRAGGSDGNERLTVLTGIVLFVLLAALGVTIVRIGSLIWEHLFIGLPLGPSSRSTLHLAGVPPGGSKVLWNLSRPL